MNVHGYNVVALETVGRFLDAVLVARDVFKGHPHLLGGDKKVVNVNPDIVRIVNSLIECEIQILEIATETTKIAGFLLHRRSADPENPIFDDKVTPQIIVSSSNSNCWKRFAVCKELMYYYVNGTGEKAWENALTNSPLSDASFLARLNSISGDFWEIKKEDELDIEHFTLCVAIEILLPWQQRSELKVMKDSAQTNRKIAERFKVPEAVIARYFETNYGSLSDECNKELDESRT